MRGASLRQVHVELGWGRAPRSVTLPAGTRVLEAPAPPPARAWAEAVTDALLPAIAAHASRIRTAVVLVPDETRKDVARQTLPTVLRALDAAGIVYSVGVATGKHPPAAGPPGAWIHNARSEALRHVGTTARGTVVCYPPAVLEADLRVLVSEVRPHYFAGYAGGAKMLFPGVAGEAGIWHNHRLKAAPGARLGVVEGNPCRADMEAAAALAGPSLALCVVRHPNGGLVGATAGDPVVAHRAAVELARPLHEVQAPAPARTVIVSDRVPVSMNLYQACKLLPPAGRVLADGGCVVMAVELHDGVGPVEVINEAIYRLGVIHSLPDSHRVLLVSSQRRTAIAPTFAEYAVDLETALRMAGDHPPLVLPYAADLVPR